MLIFGGGQALGSNLYFARYLSSTLTGNEFGPQRDFAVTSMAFLAAAYLLIQLAMFLRWAAERRRARRVRNAG